MQVIRLIQLPEIPKQPLLILIEEINTFIDGQPGQWVKIRHEQQ